jgi:hypothetical protein
LRGGRGAGLGALSATTTKRRVRGPSTMLRMVPLPASRGRISDPVLAARLSVRGLPTHAQKILPQTEAGSAAPGGAKVVAAPRGRVLPPARASGAARATGQSACANRLLRARCASRRSTAVSSPRRPARLGLKTALAPAAGSNHPRNGARFTGPSNKPPISLSPSAARASLQPPCLALSRNLSSMSARVSGSCAPPRI